MNNPVLASRVRELRKHRNLTQEQFASQLGVSRQTIFLVETGQSLPSLPLTLKMAEIFDTTIDSLINIINNPREVKMHGELLPIFPVRGMRSFHDEIDRMFEEAFGQMPSAPTAAVPPVNIHQDDKNVYVEAAVPGFAADEIETELTKDYLTIRGEKKQESQEKGKTFMRREFAYGRFERTLGLGEGLSIDKADSKIKDGKLTITLPKSPEAQPKVKKLKPKTE